MDDATINNHLQEIITKYLDNDDIPEGALLIYEKAREHFGENAVSLVNGFSAFNEYAWKADLLENLRSTPIPYSLLLGQSIRGNVSAHSALSEFPDKTQAILDTVSEFLRTTTWLFWKRLSLLIYFPKRTITNERGDTIDIYDLFVRIPINDDGKMLGQFRYCRTSYTKEQFTAGYLHSHTPSIVRSHPEYWESVCTGTGPINATIRTIQNEQNELNLGLFFWELDKIIGIESEVGGPYRHMQNVGKSNLYLPTMTHLTKRQASETFPKAFIESYLKTNRFKVVYQNKGYCLGQTFIEWLVDLTDYWYHWWNCVLEKDPYYTPVCNVNDTVDECYLYNNRLVYKPQDPSQSEQEQLDTLSQRTLVTFKGKEFKFKLLANGPEAEYKAVRLIKPHLAASLLFILLQILNYKNNKASKNDSNDEESYAQYLNRNIRNSKSETFGCIPCEDVAFL